MGWSTKWRITFISKIGRTYTADILVDGYTGSVIPLRGATNPFETRENNTEEYFAPIRTQTGYLRILDNGKDLNGNDFNWRDMMPSNDMQHQVRLIYNNNVLWIGYIKAELFTTRTFEYATEYSFPLICPLSLIERLPLSFNSYNGTLLTTVEILSLALSATGVSWNYVDISNNVQNWKDLNARINLMNFTNVDPTVNYVTEIATWTDKSSFYDVISQICKYWGWTIYSRGLNVYIVANGYSNRFRRFLYSQLSYAITSEVTYTGDMVNIGNLTYRSTNHNEDYILGRRNIMVISNSGDNINLIKPKLEELQYDWYGGTNHVISYGSQYYSIQFYLQNTTTHTEFLHNYRLVFNPVNIGSRSNIILSEDDYWSQSEEKESFSLQNNIQCLTGGTLPTSILAQRVFSIMTLHSICAPQGSMISISANARANLDPRDSYSFNPNTDYFRMYLRIGNKYWDYESESWGTSPAVLNVRIGSNAKINTTKYLFNPHNGATGFCVPMDETLYGQLEVGILMAPSRDILLNTFTVKIVPTDNMVFPTAKIEHTWSGIANATFKKDEEISLKIASGNNNTYGFGQIYNEDGSYLTSVNFFSDDGSSSTEKQPEQKLLERMQSAYGKIRHRLQVEVETNNVADLPSTKFRHWSDSNKQYSLQSVSHKWVDDTMQLTMIEL